MICHHANQCFSILHFRFKPVDTHEEHGFSDTENGLYNGVVLIRMVLVLVWWTVLKLLFFVIPILILGRVVDKLK
jgi:hypothetical protein